MVVCKFFAQGYCRYGQNCRFEHIYGSKYSYHAPQQSAPAPPVTRTDVTDEQLMNQVQSDVQAVLKGGQWILSSYAPFKEKLTLPGLSDLSPEEARLFIYEAKATNNVDQAVAYMNNLFKETRSKYELLLQPTVPVMKALRSIYRGESVTSPFSNAIENSSFANTNAAASSVFRSAVQSTPFSQTNVGTNSVFSQNNQTNPSMFSNNNVFASPDTAQSIFAQATNAFSSSPTNVFQKSPDNPAAKSIFAQANANIFAPPTQPNPANIFANASQQFQTQNDPFNMNQNRSPFQRNDAPSNVFQTSDKLPTNVFNGASINVFQQPMADDSGVYSKAEELTEDDLEAFKSDQFKLGFIPELPPPHALCIASAVVGF